MKKTTKIIAILIIIAIIMSASAFAAETRASLYIIGTTADITRGINGNIKIDFQIDCTGNMTMLGASVIKLYDSNSKLIKTLTYTDYPEMMGSNEQAYNGSVTCSGASDVSYAIVTFYAQNSSGYDYVYYTAI